VVGDAAAKPTPILTQLKQQQGEHALMQKKKAEAQRFDAEMKQYGAEIEGSKVALGNHQRAIHAARMQMAQLGPEPDAAKLQALRETEQAEVVAATELGRRLGSLEQMCIAAQRRFERFNLDLAIEGGMVEEHRRALLEAIRVKSELLKQKTSGLKQLEELLQKHQAMLQHQARQQPPNPQAMHQLQQTLAMLGQQHMGSHKHCQVIADEIKYQESLLDLLPPTPEDEESAQFNNLMSQSEQRWLIKIQAKQMHSDNPYVDDFYAHALIRKRAAMMRAAAATQGSGITRLPPAPHGPMPMGKHRRERIEQERAEKEPYTPTQYDNTLGSIKGTSIKAPKPLIEIPAAPADVHDDDGDQSHELRERSRRRKALIAIEKAYRHLLQAEDRGVKLEQPDMSFRARQQIDAERQALLDTTLAVLEVAPPDKEWSAEDDKQFWRLTAVEKGRKLMARLLMQVNRPEQVEALLQLLVRNMGIMVQPRATQDDHRAFLRSVLVLYPPAVAQAVSHVDLAVLVACFRTVNQVYDATAKEEKTEKVDIFHKFCAVLLYTLCRRADAVLSTGQAPVEQQREWSFLVEALVEKTASDLAAKIVDMKANGLYLWEFANILASHSSPAGKATLRAALHEVAAAAPPHPSIDMFGKITAPPPTAE